MTNDGTRYPKASAAKNKNGSYYSWFLDLALALGYFSYL